MERALLEVAAEAQHDFGWEICPQQLPNEVSGSCMKKGRRWFSRLRGPLSSPLQANDLWPLPETIAKAMLAEQRRESRVFSQFQVKEVHAPGDVSAELAFQDESPWYRVSVCGPHIVRVLVRKNFPGESQSTILLVPVSSTLRSLATAITAAPHPEGSLMITQVYAMPMGADPFSSTLGLSGFPALRSLTGWMECRSMSRARSLSPDHYLVLTLKKCASGSPLLPRSADAVARNSQDWFRLSYEEFELTSYLMSLLQTIGLCVTAFGELGGQRLAPYMTAVSRDEWNQNFPQLQTWLKTAGLAYKIHTGSTSGPKILEAPRPRFVEASLPGPGAFARDMPAPAGEGESSSSSSFLGSFSAEFGIMFRI